MSRLRADPLLTAARMLLYGLGGLFLFAFVLLIIGVGVMLTIERAALLTQIAEIGAPATLFWLLRLEPYTSYAIDLQSGRFDHADRLFYSLVRRCRPTPGSPRAAAQSHLPHLDSASRQLPRAGRSLLRNAGCRRRRRGTRATPRSPT